MLRFSDVGLGAARPHSSAQGDGFAVDVLKVTGYSAQPLAAVATFYGASRAEATDLACAFMNALPKK